ncbi:MAG: hypothetical protein E6J34_18270 [Chloroflexi bacterium]|nr:MAG: hypothetical protein E6J34_18270 [Chloroflexota bacterium]
MKVTISHLGAISEANIDLKPLTIFVGPNNAGKTWLAYTLASLFGPFGYKNCYEEYLKNYDEEAPGLYPLSVYLIGQGTATNVIDEDGTIELGTFGEVSDRISEIYYQL